MASQVLLSDLVPLEGCHWAQVGELSGMTFPGYTQSFSEGRFKTALFLVVMACFCLLPTAHRHHGALEPSRLFPISISS